MKKAPSSKRNKKAMKNQKGAIVILSLAIILSGCSHMTTRGSVVMKDDDQEAHVCLGDREVQSGDRVALYKSYCVSPKNARRLGNTVEAGGCRRIFLGEGRVVKTFNEHYSLVKVDPGVEFEEGSMVEKK